MSPNIGTKGNSRTLGPPAEVKAALNAIAAAQRKVLEGSRWVGGSFAEHARAMHVGDKTHETIHGQATVAEAKALVDEGVAIIPLPLPVVPPEQAN